VATSGRHRGLEISGNVVIHPAYFNGGSAVALVSVMFTRCCSFLLSELLVYNAECSKAGCWLLPVDRFKLLNLA